MVWFFAAVLQLLLVYNRAFRRVAFRLAALGIEGIFAMGAFEAPSPDGREAFGMLAAAGLVAMLVIPQLIRLATPAVGSLEWARSRIRKLS